ncbi:mechanosensitive ion channel family protein [Methyloligella sp. 2.7D]|uniref:mechanosensitive ion channel family protein n=1 Tax=unclassified Methyloligella TaxID=2625955 RepID=UPI00157D055B|nr:mechanosensitive ion channel family protein [Methyloligella sp. GL2]QKP76200.1 mechanosensitive ion channel family protein [Methyloligella sp. GL2]
MLQFMETEVYGNIITAWVIAFLVIMLVIGLGLGLRYVLVRRLPQGNPQTEMTWPEIFRELVDRLSPIVIVIAALFAGSRAVNLGGPAEAAIRSAFIIALFLQAALWADRLITASLIWKFAAQRSKTPIRNAISLMQFLLRVGIWTLALLLILDNVGFDVTALIAGLGIGGVAVALAAQNVLGDLFSSLAIVLDRPFEVGDFIVFGEKSGTVERIGIKTTRIRSLSGEQIVCANSDLITTRIHNYKRMAERRVLFQIGVAYGTPPDLLEHIPELLKQAIEGTERTRFDRAHFATYGDFSLNFEVVYFVLSEDYNVYMDVHQAINFAIYRTFAEHDIEFAFPTQTLHLEPFAGALRRGGTLPLTIARQGGAES